MEKSSATFGDLRSWLHEEGRIDALDVVRFLKNFEGNKEEAIIYILSFKDRIMTSLYRPTDFVGVEGLLNLVPELELKDSEDVSVIMGNLDKLSDLRSLQISYASEDISREDIVKISNHSSLNSLMFTSPNRPHPIGLISAGNDFEIRSLGIRHNYSTEWIKNSFVDQLTSLDLGDAYGRYSESLRTVLYRFKDVDLNVLKFGFMGDIVDVLPTKVNWDLQVFETTARCFSLENENVRSMFECSDLRILSCVNFSFGDATPEFYRSLPSSVKSLSVGSFSDHGLADLIEFGGVDDLNELEVCYSLHREELFPGLGELLAQVEWSGMSSLRLDQVYLDFSIMLSLASKKMPLKKLVFVGCNLTSDVLLGLNGSEWLDGLEEFSVEGDEFSAEDGDLSDEKVVSFFASSNWSNLKRLNLVEVGLSVDSLEYILKMDFVKNLESLDISYNPGLEDLDYGLLESLKNVNVEHCLSDDNGEVPVW